MTDPQPTILCIDDNRDLADVVAAILSDEGYAVSSLYDVEDDAVLRAVGRLEPDAVVLDGGSGVGYGIGWAIASQLASRERPVPVIMFTAHQADLQEAEAGTSPRASAADFAAIVPKPFELDEMLEAVATAVGGGTPFDRSETGETERTDELVAALTERGATEVRPSKMREWALFRDQKGRLRQLYWWQGRGVYLVARYGDAGTLKLLGQFITRDAALEMALPAEGV